MTMILRIIHNAEELQEILNRIMQGIVIIITSDLPQTMCSNEIAKTR